MQQHFESTYKLGLKISQDSGVHIPRNNRSRGLVNAFPDPLTQPTIIIIICAFGYILEACVTPS